MARAGLDGGLLILALLGIAAVALELLRRLDSQISDFEEVERRIKGSIRCGARISQAGGGGAKKLRSDIMKDAARGAPASAPDACRAG